MPNCFSHDLRCSCANIRNFICRLIAPDLTQTRGITKRILASALSWLPDHEYIQHYQDRLAFGANAFNSTSPGIYTAVPKHQGKGFWTQSSVYLQALGETCAKAGKMSTQRSERKISVSLSRSISVARDLIGASVLAQA